MGYRFLVPSGFDLEILVVSEKCLFINLSRCWTFLGVYFIACFLLNFQCWMSSQNNHHPHHHCIVKSSFTNLTIPYQYWHYDSLYYQAWYSIYRYRLSLRLCILSQLLLCLSLEFRKPRTVLAGLHLDFEGRKNQIPFHPNLAHH